MNGVPKEPDCILLHPDTRLFLKVVFRLLLDTHAMNGTHDNEQNTGHVSYDFCSCRSTCEHPKEYSERGKGEGGGILFFCEPSSFDH